MAFNIEQLINKASSINETVAGGLTVDPISWPQDPDALLEQLKAEARHLAWGANRIAGYAGALASAMGRDLLNNA